MRGRSSPPAWAGVLLGFTVGLTLACAHGQLEAAPADTGCCYACDLVVEGEVEFTETICEDLDDTAKAELLARCEAAFDGRGAGCVCRRALVVDMNDPESSPSADDCLGPL